MADFVTLEEAKRGNRISGASDDVLLGSIITACSDFIETYCGRKFAIQEFTETFSGRNMPYHMCKNGPVQAVSSVVCPELRNPSVGAVDGFMVSLGNGSVFPRGFYNCTVTYTAGFTEIPPAIKQACIELVGLKYKTIEHIDVSQKSMQGETITYIVKEMPDYIKVMLKPYRKVV